MKNTLIERVIWIIAGSIFAEAAFMVVQIVLSVLVSPNPFIWQDLLSSNNPFYAIPPHFFIVSIVFLAAIIWAQFHHIYRIGYYILISLIAAVVYLISLVMTGYTLDLNAIIINLIAAAIAGAVYWFVSPRRYAQLKS